MNVSLEPTRPEHPSPILAIVIYLIEYQQLKAVKYKLGYSGLYTNTSFNLHFLRFFLNPNSSYVPDLFWPPSLLWQNSSRTIRPSISVLLNSSRAAFASSVFSKSTKAKLHRKNRKYLLVMLH